MHMSIATTLNSICSRPGGMSIYTSIHLYRYHFNLLDGVHAGGILLLCQYTAIIGHLNLLVVVYMSKWYVRVYIIHTAIRMSL